MHYEERVPVDSLVDMRAAYMADADRAEREGFHGVAERQNEFARSLSAQMDVPGYNLQKVELVFTYKASSVKNLWVVQHSNRPTFYLDGDIQGITGGDHAAQVASQVIGVPASRSNVRKIER